MTDLLFSERQSCCSDRERERERGVQRVSVSGIQTCCSERQADGETDMLKRECETGSERQADG